MKATDRCLISIIVLACALAPASAGESSKSVLDFYASEAKASDPGFSGFSARARRASLQDQVLNRQARHAILHDLSYDRPEKDRANPRGQGH